MLVAQKSEGGQVGGCFFAEGTFIRACLIAGHMRLVSALWAGFLGAIRVDNGWTSPVEVDRELVLSDQWTGSEDLWSGFALPRPARQWANRSEEPEPIARARPTETPYSLAAVLLSQNPSAVGVGSASSSKTL